MIPSILGKRLFEDDECFDTGRECYYTIPEEIPIRTEYNNLENFNTSTSHWDFISQNDTPLENSVRRSFLQDEYIKHNQASLITHFILERVIELLPCLQSFLIENRNQPFSGLPENVLKCIDNKHQFFMNSVIYYHYFDATHKWKSIPVNDCFDNYNKIASILKRNGINDYSNLDKNDNWFIFIKKLVIPQESINEEIQLAQRMLISEEISVNPCAKEDYDKFLKKNLYSELTKYILKISRKKFSDFNSYIKNIEEKNMQKTKQADFSGVPEDILIPIKKEFHSFYNTIVMFHYYVPTWVDVPCNDPKFKNYKTIIDDFRKNEIKYIPESEQSQEWPAFRDKMQPYIERMLISPTEQSVPIKEDGSQTTPETLSSLND